MESKEAGALPPREKNKGKAPLENRAEVLNAVAGSARQTAAKIKRFRRWDEEVKKGRRERAR